MVMNMKPSLVVVGVLLALVPVGPALAQDSAQAAQEERAEAAFREIQIGLARRPSAAAEDADLMVCMRRQPTGSRLTVIECATNRFWESYRPASNQVVTQRAEDAMFQMPLADFRRLERRFGPLPEGYKGSVGAQGGH
jgi:hypothetical protein